MLNYDWPGNVRELENFIEKIIALSDIDGWEKEIFSQISMETENKFENKKLEESHPPFEDYIRKKEEEIVKWALTKANNNISKAASLLELPRTTLRSKLEKLNIHIEKK